MTDGVPKCPEQGIKRLNRCTDGVPKCPEQGIKRLNRRTDGVPKWCFCLTVKTFPS